MLAIIIPYYNFTFFEETLLSLANQTDNRFKVYIGNDASPEDPSLLLEKYKGQFDFVYHRFENNLGGISLTQQWERCIALSGNEEWIMILGDDDVLGDNVVKTFYRNLPPIVKECINLVRYATQIINGGSQIISDVYKHPKLEKATDSFFRRLKGFTRSSLSEFIFSRGSYLKHGFQDYPLAWHSDDMAWLDFPDNKPIYTINETNIFIRISEYSITGKLENKKVKQKANALFLKGCLEYKLGLFNKTQCLFLIYNYEVALKINRKLDLKESFFLMSLYLKYFKLVPFLKYNRRFLISFFNL